MVKPSHDPSISQEPHFQTPSETRENQSLETAIEADPNAEGVDHTVWDEPTLLANDNSPKPSDNELTYERWITAGINQTTWIDSLSITLLLVLAAGPWGILGAFMSAFSADSVYKLGNLFAAAILAPVTEEITKVAATLWVVEKRPYWFKSIWQIVLCAIAGGALFAVIENLIYIYIYHPRGNEAFQQWRWSVCTGLHMSCSFIVGIGLARIWDNAIRNRSRPELALGMPYFATAMIGHGVYNFSVTVAEASGLLDFLSEQ